MAEPPKKVKEIGRSKSLMSTGLRREMKSSTLPSNTRNISVSSGEGFFTKLKRCLRLGSKGRYNVNAIQTGMLPTNSPVVDKVEKRQNIVSRATSLRLTRRSHADKEEVVLIHKAKMKSGNGLFPNRSVSETIPEDKETIVCIVNGESHLENGQIPEAAAAVDADDVFEMDPGYETLEEIRRKVRLQEAASKANANGGSVVLQTEVVKPTNLDKSANGLPPFDNGQDSGITTPTTESPESGRDSQVRSVTSSMFSDSVLMDEGNHIDLIEPEEVTTRNGVMHRLNSCPSDSMNRPHRDGHRYCSDSFLTKPLQDDTDSDLYANPQILFRKQSKNKSMSSSTIIVHRAEPSTDLLSVPRGMGEKSVSEGDINPIRGSSVESDSAPPLPDRKYLASEARISRVETDDEQSADNDCSTSTTLSASHGLGHSHDSVVTINSIKEISTENLKTPEFETSDPKQTLKPMDLNGDMAPASERDNAITTSCFTSDSTSNECDVLKNPFPEANMCESPSSVDAAQNKEVPTPECIMSQGQEIQISNTNCDTHEVISSDSSVHVRLSDSDFQTADGCECISATDIQDIKQTTENCDVLDSLSLDSVERRETKVSSSSEEFTDQNNVVMLKLHESTHEDSLLGDAKSEEGVSESSMARLEKKAAKLQLGPQQDSTEVSNPEEEPETSTDAVASSEVGAAGGSEEVSQNNGACCQHGQSRKRKRKEEPIHMSLAEVMNSETDDGCEADDDNDYEELTDDESEEPEAAPQGASPQTSTSSTADAHRAFLESMRQLKDCGWYWGPLSYSEAIAKLTNKPDGSFLVRDSSNDSYILSLSFNCLGTVCHTRIEHNKGIFSFWSQPDSHGRATIKEFIEQAVQFSHTGKFLYFLRPSGPGSPPIPIRLLYPLSRFCRVQSLQHMCRFLILRWVRRDHIDVLPVPEKVKNYLRENQYYVETLEED